jgi:hypothetical protein
MSVRSTRDFYSSCRPSGRALATTSWGSVELTSPFDLATGVQVCPCRAPLLPPSPHPVWLFHVHCWCAARWSCRSGALSHYALLVSGLLPSRRAGCFTLYIALPDHHPTATAPSRCVGCVAPSTASLIATTRQLTPAAVLLRPHRGKALGLRDAQLQALARRRVLKPHLRRLCT